MRARTGWALRRLRFRNLRIVKDSVCHFEAGDSFSQIGRAGCDVILEPTQRIPQCFLDIAFGGIGRPPVRPHSKQWISENRINVLAGGEEGRGCLGRRGIAACSLLRQPVALRLAIALMLFNGVGAVEVCSEGGGKEVEELRTLARGKRQWRVDFGGEEGEGAATGGRLHSCLIDQ